jgi:hypothetical protein
MQENIPIQEVFESLRCSRRGLTEAQAEQRLDVFGPNKLEEKKESKVLKFLGFMWNPLSWVMEAAAIMAIALANGGVSLPRPCSTRPLDSIDRSRNDSGGDYEELASLFSGQAAGLGGLRRDHHAAHHQLLHLLLRGEQCR